jgi:hypothetical protein
VPSPPLPPDQLVQAQEPADAIRHATDEEINELARLRAAGAGVSGFVRFFSVLGCAKPTQLPASTRGCE